MSKDEKRIFRIATLLFLLSGLAGLAYEVIWFKRFAYVWGNSSLAAAAVVASFLFGLALGAQVLGRWADRIRRPLLAYGFCEAAIGLLALVIPYEIDRLMQSVAQFYTLLQPHPWAHTALRFLLTFVALGPPCFLMGGTLPLMIKQFSPPHFSRRESVGWFYAVNTVGAALGCWLTGFHILPSVGLFWTNLLAVALNLDIALIAFFLAREWKKRMSPPEESAPALSESTSAGIAACSPVSLRALHPAVTVAGAAALILEMVWTRQLALILGGTTYAFTAMLFVVLVGIGLGSYGFDRWHRKERDPRFALSVCILILLVAVMAGYHLIPLLTQWVAYIRRLRASQILNALICLSVSGVLELIPALCMGFLFPLFVALARRSAGDAGKAVGSVYTWNTLGSIIGASLTSLCLIPSLGSAGTVVLTLLLYCAALAALTWMKPRRFHLAFWGALLVALAALFGGIREEDPRFTNLGSFIYGYTPTEDLLKIFKVLYFKEGAACNVLVTAEGDHRALRVNGKVDASTTGDMPMQLGLAYLPRFLHPQAQNVFIIGFGSGTTAGASLLFPNTQVKCCELEPRVFAASLQFAHINHSPEYARNFSIVFEDGRAYLQGTPEKYDLILSEPSNPWMTGVSNLFTAEFYRLAKQRLKPGGILTQWIQTYLMTISDYAMIVRTVMREFPHSALLYTSEGDTLLLASESPIEFTKERLRTAQTMIDTHPEVIADLEKYYGTKDVFSIFLIRYCLDERGLQRLAENGQAGLYNTDSNLQLEFDAPLMLFRPQGEDVYSTILKSTDPYWYSKNFLEWECSKNQLKAWKKLIELYRDSGILTTAGELVKFGAEWFADDPYFIAEHLIWTPAENADSFEALLAKLLPLSPDEAFRAAQYMRSTKQYRRAIEIYNRMAQLHPAWASVWLQLAINYKAVDEREKADAAFRQSLALDPFNESARKEYEDFQNSK